MRAPVPKALSAWVVLMFVARSAVAAPSIVYAPPPHCPTAAAFRARLEDVVRVPLARRSAEDRVDVRFLPRNDGESSTLQSVTVTTRVGGRIVERTFHGEDCTALVDAATLAAALVLDEESERAAPAVPTAPEERRGIGATVGLLPGFGRNGTPLVGAIAVFERRGHGIELGAAFGPAISGPGAATNGIGRAAYCGGPSSTGSEVRGCIGAALGLRWGTDGRSTLWAGPSAGLRVRMSMGKRWFFQVGAELQAVQRVAGRNTGAPSATMRAEGALLVPF